MMVGQRFGAYEVLALLGEGGMGAVYRARDTKLNRDVALKVLLPEVANDPEQLARFRREAQVLARSADADPGCADAAARATGVGRWVGGVESPAA